MPIYQVLPVGPPPPMILPPVPLFRQCTDYMELNSPTRKFSVATGNQWKCDIGWWWDPHDGNFGSTIEWLLVFSNFNHWNQWYQCFLGLCTHWTQWFYNGFWIDNHWTRWFFNGSKPLIKQCIKLVTMDRWGLFVILPPVIGESEQTSIFSCSACARACGHQIEYKKKRGLERCGMVSHHWWSWNQTCWLCCR